MKEKLNKIKQDILQELERTQTTEQLEQVYNKYFSRKSGDFSKLMKDIKNVSEEYRPILGKIANDVKKETQNAFKILQDKLINNQKSNSRQGFGGQAKVQTQEILDVTLPGRDQKVGTLHPITQVKNDLNDAFRALGFTIYEGPEITTEHYAFDNLNFPEDHPARETMDTYWVAGQKSHLRQGYGGQAKVEAQKSIEKLCLRPHLTGGSVRYIQMQEPPFRIVYPGRVFRSEATDAGHERCFYQWEALIVNERVSIAGGKILVKTILSKVFNKEVKVRMRTGFFPFVEPGFEIDMECLNCGGQGCSVCGDGWVEVMPGGPPHPNVLRAGGIDPEKWQGFYINIGLDRLVMMKYGIDDIRLMHSGDLRFLKQF